MVVMLSYQKQRQIRFLFQGENFGLVIKIAYYLKFYMEPGNEIQKSIGLLDEHSGIYSTRREGNKSSQQAFKSNSTRRWK
jgi:hypothetical protein